MFPCPRCDQQFLDSDELLNHALYFHSPQDLSNVLRERMKKLDKDDFIQIDSQWIYALGGFHLSLLPNRNGDFSLQVYGSIEPIPKATQYPSEPEWDKALALANKFMSAYAVAVEKDEFK